MPNTVERPRTRAKLPSREQAVLEELSGVLHKHQDQPPGALVRLLALAGEAQIGLGRSREDRLARAQVRGLGVRQQLAAAEGGTLSSDEVARLLGISRTAVFKRLEAGRLLAWREERLQAARFPRWQFDEQGHVLSGLGHALEVLGGAARLVGWDKVLFFLQPKGSLGDRWPLDLLREGKLEEVRLAAQAYAD